MPPPSPPHAARCSAAWGNSQDRTPPSAGFSDGQNKEDELSDQAIMPSSGYGDIQKKYSTLLNTSTE